MDPVDRDVCLGLFVVLFVVIVSIGIISCTGSREQPTRIPPTAEEFRKKCENLHDGLTTWHANGCFILFLKDIRDELRRIE